MFPCIHNLMRTTPQHMTSGPPQTIYIYHSAPLLHGARKSGQTSHLARANPSISPSDMLYRRFSGFAARCAPLIPVPSHNPYHYTWTTCELSVSRSIYLIRSVVNILILGLTTWGIPDPIILSHLSISPRIIIFPIFLARACTQQPSHAVKNMSSIPSCFQPHTKVPGCGASYFSLIFCSYVRLTSHCPQFCNKLLYTHTQLHVTVSHILLEIHLIIQCTTHSTTVQWTFIGQAKILY